MGHLGPGAEQWETLRNHPDQAAKVVMLNLLKFRASADYSDPPDEESCSGEEAYRRYSALAFPCVQAVGGRLVFSGKTGATIIGPTDETWDEVLLVEYPSLAAFLEMMASEEYRSIVHHRMAALEDSRLVPIIGG